MKVDIAVLWGRGLHDSWAQVREEIHTIPLSQDQGAKGSTSTSRSKLIKVERR